MGSNGEACAECTRSCLALHRKKADPYAIVSSFFKVMFGKQFSEELIVPPRFAKKLASLVGRNTYLEDSTGQKWDVHLSKVKGSLVFESGWHEFSVDHGIELGDFVVFHYITGSHFIVQVFARSGCERPVLFNELKFQKKRSKTARDSTVEGGSDGTSNTEMPPKVSSDSCMVAELDVDSVRRQDTVSKSVILAEDRPSKGKSRKRPKVIPADDFLIEPYFITNRSTNSCREDNRDHLFDLSAFEITVKKVDSVETSIIQVNKGPELVNESQDALIATVSPDVEKWQVAETSPLLLSNEACTGKEESSLLLKGSSDIDMPSPSYMLQDITTPTASELPAAAADSQPPGATTSIVQKEQNSCRSVGLYGTAHDSHNAHRDSAKLCKLKEPMINNGDLGISNVKVSPSKGILKKIVKPEPDDFCDSTSSLVTKITCKVEQDSEPFLALPESLPIKLWKLGARLEKKLIVLRDPAGRRWPVLYHERKGINVLANGWKEFRKYNNIQLGDQCSFVLENMEDCVFQVEIRRR